MNQIPDPPMAPSPIVVRLIYFPGRPDPMVEIWSRIVRADGETLYPYRRLNCPEFEDYASYLRELGRASIHMFQSSQPTGGQDS